MNWFLMMMPIMAIALAIPIMLHYLTDGGGYRGVMFSIMTGMIGISITILIGYLIIGEVSTSLGCSSTTNASCETFDIFDLFDDSVTYTSNENVEPEIEYIPPPKVKASDIVANTTTIEIEDFDFSLLDDEDLLSVDLE